TSGSDTIQYLYTNTGTASAPSLPEMGDPLANLWLLILRVGATPKLFICPSDPTNPQPADTQLQQATGPLSLVNFGTVQGALVNTCSYAVAYPWARTSDPPAYWWR